MAEIACPECGEDDDLTGRASGDLIHITCGACGREWDRDPSPRCPTCDGDQMHDALRAIVERSRGTQLSIVSTEVVHLCADCDAEVLARYRRGRSPLMPAELPTVHPEDR